MLSWGELVRFSSFNFRKNQCDRSTGSKCGIHLTNIVASGDDINDIEMLKVCGIGVAVANGIPEVLEAANQIIAENDKDGAAKWLEIEILHK